MQKSIKYLPKIEQQAIEEFKQHLINKWGDNFLLLKLYGSKARGKWHKESDIDLLTVFHHRPLSLKNQLADLEWEIKNKYGFKVYLSTNSYPLKEYQRYRSISNYLFNVEKEGIDLWRNPKMVKF